MAACQCLPSSVVPDSNPASWPFASVCCHGRGGKGRRSMVASVLPCEHHKPSASSNDASPLLVVKKERAEGKTKRQQPLVARKEHLSSQALASRLLKIASLPEGERIHALISEIGLDEDTYLSNLLISMYRKFGCLDKARAVFDNLPYPEVTSWNNMITAYGKHAHFTDALQLFQQMLQQGCKPNRVTFITVLAACNSSKTLAEGKWIHAHIVKERLKSDTGINNALISMYSKCGDLKEAISVFRELKDRNLVTWNSMISAYCKHGQGNEALGLFTKMQKQGINPDGYTFASLLNAFTSPTCLAKAKEIHECVIDHGFHTHLIVANALISMYNKCGDADMAFSAFEQIPKPDLISWTAMIDAYAQNGHGNKALQMYHQMLRQGHKPNSITFRSALTACASVADLKQGKLIHRMAKDKGLVGDVLLANGLIYMYGKCGAVKDARAIFDEMPVHDTVSLTIMLHAYSSNNHARETLQLFGEMQQEGIEPDKVHFISVLDACGHLSALEAGKAIHAYVSDKGFLSDIHLGNALICMYGKCADLKEAYTVFHKMHKRDVVTWNALITAYTINRSFKEAYGCLSKMQEDGLEPNKVTFMCVLRACVDPETLAEGKAVHLQVIEHGLEGEKDLACLLISMYGKCGTVEDAQSVFDHVESPDVALWNAMVTAHSHHGNGKEALQVFRQMEAHSLKPDKFTFVAMLEACSLLPAPDVGRDLHASIRDAGLESDEFIAVGLINMYGKLKALEEAREVFDQLITCNVVAWTAMIDAYSQCGCSKEAMQLYSLMQPKGMHPNEITFVCLLCSCDNPSALELGKIVHTFIVLRGFDVDLIIGNSLVSMYGKCGSIQDARKAFDSIQQRDVISWTTLIDVYIKLGYEEETLHLYEEMQREKIQPNRVTFIRLVHVCSKLKALEKGKAIHTSIVHAGMLSCDGLKKAIITMYHSCGAVEELGGISN